MVDFDGDSDLEIIYGSSSGVGNINIGDTPYTPDLAILDLNSTAVEHLNTPENYLLLKLS